MIVANQTIYTKLIYRLIPSRFPPINMFHWADSEEEMVLLAKLEGMTNERLQNEVGDLSLVPKHQQKYGAGYSSIMAAFTHVGFKNRFSDGSYGVYYAAATLDTAICEALHRRKTLLDASNEAETSLTMRAYTAALEKQAKLVAINKATHPHLLDEDFQASNNFARELRQQEAWGIRYPSVRDTNGTCFAILRPDALSPATQSGHYRFFYNKEKKIGRVTYND